MENKKRILLIEDRDTDFKKVLNFFKNYEVIFSPSNDLEYQQLARLVITYSRSNEKRKEEFINKIGESIKSFNPDIILLDLGLDGNEKNLERHGIDILKYINKNLDPSILKFIISRHSERGDIECDGYIVKGKPPIETQLEEKIITPLKISKYVSPSTQNADGATNNNEPNKSAELLTKLEKYETFDYKYISPWISTILDKIITYVFYFLILALFGIAPIDIYKNAIEHGDEGMLIDSFKIAERTFIAFLPFLITCGFYIFYTKSLRSYFFNSIVDPRIEDFESSSVLMKLSKKLFISSLLSYLFIKLIELLCFEKLDEKDKFFDDFYGKSNPYLQLYFTCGLVVILILYYIYIDRNQNHKNNKNNDDKID